MNENSICLMDIIFLRSLPVAFIWCTSPKVGMSDSFIKWSTGKKKLTWKDRKILKSQYFQSMAKLNKILYKQRRFYCVKSKVRKGKNAYVSAILGMQRSGNISEKDRELVKDEECQNIANNKLNYSRSQLRDISALSMVLAQIPIFFLWTCHSG